MLKPTGKVRNWINARFRRHIERDFIVWDAMAWDLWRGWIRLNINDRMEDGVEIIPRKAICMIEVNNEKTYRQILGNDKRKFKGKSQGLILMDYETRNELKLKLRAKYHFKITRVCSLIDIWRWFCFYWYHPDRAINIGFKLGSICIILAVISIIIAI